MSARRFLALLVVVVLGLLLANPAALSRTEAPLHRATSWYEDAGNPDEDDPDDPNGFVDGDDDNWDRPSGHGHAVADLGGAEVGTETGAVTDTSERLLSWTEVGLRSTIAALLRAWSSFFNLR
ncbi:MAG: hypothetical protein JXB46_05035 [Candidatus Eisenbacteria bacterium]|nr:hypothetical protein [Candidatus Eisenbacteria bacterium]